MAIYVSCISKYRYYRYVLRYYLKLALEISLLKIKIRNIQNSISQLQSNNFDYIKVYS
jgi:hypothetical protein